MTRPVHLVLLSLTLSLAGGCARTSPDEKKRPAPEAGAAEKKEKDEKPEEEAKLPERVQLTAEAIKEAGIQTWKAEPSDVGNVLVLTGTVGHNENRLVHVASNVKGRVTSIPVDLGSHVRKGEPLVWLESLELAHARDEFVKALAELRVSAKSYERAKALLEGKAISAGEFQSREGTYLARKAEAETAERTLRLYGEDERAIQALRASLDSMDALQPATEPHLLAIRSPFEGRVTERKVTPGSLVEALQPLVTVADLSSVWVFLQAYEKDLARLHEGLSVSIRPEAYPDKAFRGRLDFLSSFVDESTRSMRVRATVENPTEELRPGMFVRAQVELPGPRQEARPVLAVPQAALQTLEGRTCVFVESGSGTFLRRSVETGRTFDGSIEVLSGLKEGDTVVTEGSFVVKSEFTRATLSEEE